MSHYCCKRCTQRYDDCVCVAEPRITVLKKREVRNGVEVMQESFHIGLKRLFQELKEESQTNEC